VIFFKIIDNKKLEKNNKADDDVYNMHIKIDAIRTYSGLEI
jgi:predicted component of viral defense system (DUF524 family)